MGRQIKHTVRLLLFILIQVFVLNQVPPLHYYVNPYIYYLFILWLPFKIGRRTLLIVAFLTGLFLDYFMKTPGLHAAPCVLIAYLRPFLINMLISQEGAEANYDEPSIRSMGFAPYFTYAAVLTLIHHAFLFLLEALQFAGFIYFLSKTLLSVIISLVLVLIVELLFVRKQRFLTNTA